MQNKIQDKLDRLNKKLKQSRIEDAQKSNKEWIGNLLLMFGIGIIGIMWGFTLNPNTHMTNIEQSYYIDGWHIEMMDGGHPEMEGRVGFTNHSNQIYLEAGRKPVETYRTCVHEIKHNTNPEMEHPDHDWWFEKQEQTYNEVCIKLMAKLDVEKTYFDKYGKFVETMY